MLAKEPLTTSWHGWISGLALMATGNPDYLPMVRELAYKAGPGEPRHSERAERGRPGIRLPQYFPMRILPAHRGQEGAARDQRDHAAPVFSHAGRA